MHKCIYIYTVGKKYSGSKKININKNEKKQIGCNSILYYK